MVNEVKELTQQITEGTQDKKGKKVVITDPTQIGDTIRNYFAVRQGSSPSQVSITIDSVRDLTRKRANSRPFVVGGLRSAEWVTMDYSDVLIHVFLPKVREFCNLGHLWTDTKLTQVPNLD